LYDDHHINCQDPTRIDPFRSTSSANQRISAEFASNDLLHIEVDVFGLSEEQLSLVAGKIGKAVSIHHAHWHRLV
jgi:hypothetical protein